MVSHRRLLAVVEAALLSPNPAPQHRADLLHALHVCLPDLQAFLKYPGPKAEDRAQVTSKDVRLPNSAPTILDNQDAQIALKLSEDYNLNEITCVGLLVSAHQEWNLLGREPVEVLRLSAGLWFTERRALITALQLLLRAVVLDDELDPDLVADIRLYIERLLDGGLRARLISLIKEMNREEPAGLGGPGVEPYVTDSRGALVQRRNVIQKERLSLCHCLVLTCLIVRINAPEAKDLYNLLKDCASDESLAQDVVLLQITYTIMFALTNSLTSDALGGSQEMGSVLALDSGFRKEFQQLIMDGAELSVTAEGFTGVIRFAWAVYLLLTRGASEYNVSGSFSEDETHSRACLIRACEHDVFDFFTTRVLQTATFQNDDEDLVFMYNAYLHKLMTSFLSQPVGREKIKEMKDAAVAAVDPYVVDLKDTMSDVDGRAQEQAVELQAKPFISLLNLVGEIYQREPELVVDNEDLWNFVRFAGEDHSTYHTLVAFLNMLTALASSEEGAKKVYQMLQNKSIRLLGWQTLFNSLVVYDQRFRQCLQTAGSFLPPLQEGDARALEAYLKVLRRVMEKGNEMERSQWFMDIEPLFKLLSYENVPPYLKGALRNAIATFVPVSPVMKNKVWSLLEQYDLPVAATPVSSDGVGQKLSSQVYDMTFELNEVEARQEEYSSTLACNWKSNVTKRPIELLEDDEDVIVTKTATALTSQQLFSMKGVEELSDDDDYIPISASRYFNKSRAFSEVLPDRANRDGSSNGKALGVPTSSAVASDKNKKSVAEFDNFAFSRKSNLAKRPIESLEGDEDVVLTKTTTAPGFLQRNGNKRRRRKQTISDSDDDDPVVKGSFGGNHTTREGADECAGDEALAAKLQDEEYPSGRGRTRQVHFLSDSDEEEEEEVNPITITLQRCDLIAASLREELRASGSSENTINEDRYAEVDVAAAKIVSQGDVCTACGIAENDTERMLKPYQLVGVNFMLLLHRKHVGGAILADEMGLGKTVQAVAFLALLKHLDGDAGPHLLVAPASLLENWQRELRKWCPAFKVELYHGPGRVSLNRKLQYVAKSKGPAPFNVMLTCYSLFERQSAQTKDDRKFLKKWNWSCVVMDEAHLLKDRSSFRSKKLRDIAHMAKQRLMLTGTPLQNDLQELWSLLEFMMPDVFDTNGIDLDQYLGTRNASSGVVVQDTNLMNRIKGILGPFVLRRLKSDVMRQLVSKIQEVECVEMLDEQESAYKTAINEYRALAEAERAARSSKKSSKSLVDALPRRQVTNIFTQLRKLGNHPLLIRRLYSDETVKKLAKKYHPLGVFGDECDLQRVEDELSSYSDFALHKLCISYGGVAGGQGKLADDHVLASAKCQVLSRLLPKLQEGGHRPLIFSQWTSMLDILEWALDVMGFPYTRLDGSTQVSDRQSLVDEFNNDPSIFVFLLSTRAGGQGLNLTGADTVILHDLDFNPQMDRQAEDRCHRIGQSKPVTIYRLVTKNTVDESIYKIAQQKLVLDAAVLEGKESCDNNDGDARTMAEILSALLDAPQP